MAASDQPVDLAREFAAAADELLCGMAAREMTRRASAEDREANQAWGAVVDAGWPAILLSEELGGLGLGPAELAPVCRAAGRYLLPGPLIEHAVIAAITANHLPPTPARDLLVEAIAGDGVIATSERARSTPLARASAGRLTGELGPLRFGAIASHLLLAVEWGDGSAPLVLLPTSRDGVIVRDCGGLDPDLRLADVELDNVRLEADDLCNPVEVAALHADVERVLRLAVSCMLAGIAERALELSVAYAKERRQFDRPIGSFQAVQHLLADMAASTHSVTSLCDAAAAAGSDTREDVGSVVKAHAARSARSVVEAAMQVHGGIAFTREHVLHRYYLRALALEHVGGEPSAIELELGRRLLRAPTDPWARW